MKPAWRTPQSQKTGPCRTKALALFVRYFLNRHSRKCPKKRRTAGARLKGAVRFFDGYLESASRSSVRRVIRPSLVQPSGPYWLRRADFFHGDELDDCTSPSPIDEPTHELKTEGE